MASIFASAEHKSYWTHTPSFYSKKHSEVEFTEQLGKLSKPMSQARLYSIEDTKLVCLSTKTGLKKYTDLTLKLLEPFAMQSESLTLFGFRLGSKDFSVSSSTKLEEWLDRLTSRCILSSFDEDFVIIKTIGQGISTVYLAHSRSTKEPFAVKRMSKSAISSSYSSLNNLKEEIRILRTVANRNIAKLYYVYEDSKYVYLVMEYLPEGDLSKRFFLRKKFDEDTCVKFTRSLLKTLEYLHSNNIVHRDLKLENIVMVNDEDYEFKIVDFGIAYSSDQEQTAKCGSPGFMAPEMIRCQSYDNKIDIFSAGVILYILLCGKHPFTGRNFFKNNIECKYKINKKVSAGAADIIRLMMEPDPSLRQNASELLKHPWLGGGERTGTRVASEISNFRTLVCK